MGKSASLFFLNPKPDNPINSSCMTHPADRSRSQTTIWELHLSCMGNPSEAELVHYWRMGQTLVASEKNLHTRQHFSMWLVTTRNRGFEVFFFSPTSFRLAVQTEFLQEKLHHSTAIKQTGETQPAIHCKIPGSWIPSSAITLPEALSQVLLLPPASSYNMMWMKPFQIL